MSDKSHELDLGDDPEEISTAESGWDYLTDGSRIRCVFSTSRTVKMGMGANSRKEESKTYWFVEQVDHDLFEARKINAKHVPTGDAESVSMNTLINSYTPQIAYYEEFVLPAMAELNQILDEGDDHRKDGRYYSAEMEYGRALEIEEKSVRALFGLGLIFASRKELGRTRELLSDLVNIKAAFDGKNQHLFNEFGISLRKINLFAEAVTYYQRGLDFVKNDENLYYNLARAHYEEGDWHGCLEGLIMSHRLNPKLGLARDLFQVIVGLSEDEKLLQHYGKPPVPPKVAARARQILAVETGSLALDEGPLHFGSEQGRARSGRIIGSMGVDSIHLDDKDND